MEMLVRMVQGRTAENSISLVFPLQLINSLERIDNCFLMVISFSQNDSYYLIFYSRHFYSGNQPG